MTPCDLGMIGLGVMGRNLVLNLGDAGFALAGTDRDLTKIAALRAEAGGRSIVAFDGVEPLVAALKRPRVVMMLVPAGPPVDAVIAEVAPLLAAGDVLVDGGNSHFRDTDRRVALLEPSGIRYLGLGVSGGEAGARHGASLMPGGSREAWDRVRPLLEAAAAKVDGEPCVAYLGPGSAGHYVKMVHNAIEYGVMQLIAETYDVARRGLDLSNDALAELYGRWNEGPFASFLLEITASIFRRRDEETGQRLVDLIRDAAGQKGTGAWASEDAAALQLPVPTLDVAVSARALSARRAEREGARRVLGPAARRRDRDVESALRRLRGAFGAAAIVAYSQGLALLAAASDARGYGLELATVARVWRGGCIIRAAVLGPLMDAYRRRPALANPLLDETIAKEVASRDDDLRASVTSSVALGVPIPALSVSLAYLDSLRSERLPANLVQAQRDYFGAHGYERVDRPGTFHTAWSEP